MELKSGKKKDNTRKSGAQNQAIQAKREEANQRSEAYSKLTATQKLAKLDAGNFAAKKQRAKLEKQISGGK